MDKLATEYHNEQLLKQSKTAREATQKYADQYRTGVSALKENKKAVEVMVQKGELVGDAADKFLNMQVTAYTNARKSGASAEQLNAYVQRYIITTNIDTHALTIMREEKEEVNYKDRTAYKNMQKLLPELMQLYNDLENITTASEEVQLIRDARQATKEYTQATENWIQNDACPNRSS
ncbi:hypothetical protein WDW89_17150 [Deltaproteobacteria bacterium TL4]